MAYAIRGYICILPVYIYINFLNFPVSALVTELKDLVNIRCVTLIPKKPGTHDTKHFYKEINILQNSFSNLEFGSH